MEKSLLVSHNPMGFLLAPLDHLASWLEYTGSSKVSEWMDGCVSQYIRILMYFPVD